MNPPMHRDRVEPSQNILDLAAMYDRGAHIRYERDGNVTFTDPNRQRQRPATNGRAERYSLLTDDGIPPNTTITIKVDGNEMTINNSAFAEYRDFRQSLTSTLRQNHPSCITTAELSIIALNLIVFVLFFVYQANFDWREFVAVLINLLLLVSFPCILFITNNRLMLRFLNRTANVKSWKHVVLCMFASLTISVVFEVAIFYVYELKFGLLFAMICARLWYTVFMIIYGFGKYLKQLQDSEPKSRFPVIITFSRDNSGVVTRTMSVDSTQKDNLMEQISRSFPLYRLASSALSKFLIPLAVHFAYACILYAVYRFYNKNVVFLLIAVTNMFEFYFYLLAGLCLNSSVIFIENLFPGADLRLRLRLGFMDVDSKLLISIVVPILTYLANAAN
jgi:hypothetical protein